MPDMLLNWLQSLMDFSNILNASISASWMVLAILMLRFIMKKSPKWFYVLLWGLVAIRLIMPFSIESAFSLIPSVQTVPQEILRYQGVQLSQPAYVDIITNPNLFGSLSIELSQTVDRIQWRLVYMTFVWITGICIMLLYTVISYLYLRRRIYTAVRYKDNIFQSENIDSPFVLGIFRPKIYMPYTIENEDISHVIAHENAHISRKDHWWKPLGFILLTIHWFNPVMWLAYIILCRDIELACDEKVIKELGNEQRADYTQALVNCSINRRIVAACPLAFGEIGVKDRVKSVLNYKKPAFWVVTVSVVASIFVAVCFLTNPATSVDERLAVFIDCEIAYHNQTERSADNYCCLDWQVIGKEKKGNETTVYMWTLYREYSNNSSLEVETASHLLTAITVEKEGENYKLIEYWVPEDGSRYKDSIMDKLPAHLWNKALNSQKYMGIQSKKLDEMAESHFGVIRVKDKITIEGFDSGLTVTLSSSEEAGLIANILSSSNWIEGTADCLSDFEITVGRHRYLYHLSCGTINDSKNNRSLSLDDEQKAAVENLLWNLDMIKTTHYPAHKGLYTATPEWQKDALYEKEEFIINKMHFLSVYDEWICGEYAYKYRLEVTGKMSNAEKNTTFIVLSNTQDISFDSVWKASGFSSNMSDYFEPENAVIVGYRTFS